MTATQIHGLEALFDDLLEALEMCMNEHIIPTLDANERVYQMPGGKVAHLWSEQDGAKMTLEQDLMTYRDRLRELLG